MKTSSMTTDHSKYIQIQQTLADDLPVVKGDSAQLRQVLHNLLAECSGCVD